jgi:hypothetical protein
MDTSDDHGRRWAVVLPGKQVYLLRDERQAKDFAGWLTANVDPGFALPVADPVDEMLTGAEAAEAGGQLAGAAVPSGSAAFAALTAARWPLTRPASADADLVMSDACRSGDCAACPEWGRFGESFGDVRCECPRHRDPTRPCAGSLAGVRLLRPAPDHEG